MHSIKDLLTRVDTVVTNSQTDTLIEIKNISNILEVDGKTATLLHFVNKDGHWNPNTLTMLEDVLEKLNLKEQYITQTPEKKKEIKDFYLLNYLSRYWKDLIIKRLKDGKGLHYVNVFLRKVTSEMIADLQKLGLYPELSKDNLEDFQQDDAFAGGGPSMLIYKPVSDWLRELINSAELPFYQGSIEQGMPDSIIETVKEIKEEDRITSLEQFREVIKNIEKLYGPKEDNSKDEDEVIEEQGLAGGMASNTYGASGQGYQFAKTGTINKPQNPFKAEDQWYHYVIDAISLIAYLVCGVTYGIGCAVSVIADICNALLYVYTKKDYYMAGMQLAFAVVPAGEALKYLAKPLRKPLNVVFKAAWHTMKVDAEIIAKEVLKLTPAQLKFAKKIFPKSLAKKLLKNYNVALAAATRFYSSVPGLETMMTHAGYLIRALVIFIEMIWYDPGMPAELIELLAGQNSFSDWLKERPKIGLDLWSNYLEWKDNFRGAITTTPYDCTGKVFVWLKEDVKTDNDVSIQQSWLDDGYKEEDFNEENVWKEWQGGWRPENLTSQTILLYNTGIKEQPELIKKYNKYLKDCFTFEKYINSNKDEDIKMMYLIFTEMGATEADIDKMYEILNPTSNADHIKQMSKAVMK